MISALDDDLALAHGLADLAAEVALDFFRRGVSAQLKDDGTPVTHADLEVEGQLLDLLARERPDDSVLSEECGARGCSSRRWILDPIDWTVNFVAGDFRWGTNVALEDNGEILVGVITRPVSGGRWWARRGGGAYRSVNGGPAVRLDVSSVSPTDQSRIGRVATHVCDDQFFELLDGRLDALVDDTHTCKAWDYAPTVILIEEAGGRFRDGAGGRRIDLGTAVYTNGLVDEVEGVA